MFAGGDFPDEPRPGIGEVYSRMLDLELRGATSELGGMQSNLIVNPTVANWIQLMRVRRTYADTYERAALNIAESQTGFANRMQAIREGQTEARHRQLYKALAYRPSGAPWLRRHRLAHANEMLADGMYSIVKRLTAVFDYKVCEKSDSDYFLWGDQTQVSVRLLMDCVDSELDLETRVLTAVGLRKKQYLELMELGVPLASIYG